MTITWLRRPVHLTYTAIAAVLLILAASLVLVQPRATADQNESANPTTANLESRITAGALHTCALLDSGGVRCWGNNTEGELGNGTAIPSTVPVGVSGITTAQAVTAGSTHTCALLHGGTVACWGNNGNGQLGDGTSSGGLTPVLAQGITTATAVAAGGFHTCALLADGTVTCWGSDGSGQLGDGGSGTRPAPVAVHGITAANKATALAAGEFFTCALMADGTVECWGNNGFGQLGDGVTTTSGTPVTVTTVPAPGHKVLNITAGSGHACAQVDDGTIHCWGSDSYGQLGNGVSGTVHDASTPVTVTAIGAANPPKALTAGQFHTCALLRDTTIKCWGNNGRAQLGDLSTTTRMTPVQVFGLSGATAVTAGGFHTCALIAATLECWGYDFYGQLGSSVDQSASPVQVTDLSGDLTTPAGHTTTTVLAVSAGTDFACALIPNGSAADRVPFCWGSNANGRLGAGSAAAQSSVPLAVSGLPTAAQLDAGNGHACALPMGSGAPQCWGFNATGQLGDATTTNRSAPVGVSGLATAAQVSAGGEFVQPSGPERGHTCALVSGGTAQCWGRNANGQLGNNTTSDSAVPVSVANMTTATAVSAGGLDSCARMTDGTVECWGWNGFGQLGNKSTTDTAVPVTVHKITTAVAIATGADHNCALLSDGTVACWGHNDHGQLGDASNTDRHEPVAVSGITALNPAIAITAGDYHTCAELRDNTVVCWGDGADGQLGNGSFSDSNTPVGALAGVPSSVLSAIAPKQFITSISAGRRDTCAGREDSTVLCWGSNDHGQLGDGIGATSVVPRAVADLGGTLNGNHLPNPIDHTVTTTAGVSVTVSLLQGATDADGNTISLVSVSNPAHGTVSVVTATAVATYTPNPAVCGNDTFTYTVTDGIAQVAATVTVLMNCPPTPAPDAVTTPENQSVSLTVLANDTDPDHDPLTVTGNDTPAHGTVSLAPDGTGTYTPTHDVCGTDSFGYTVSDGQGHTASTSVTITVTCVNQPPVAGPDTASTPQGTAVSIPVLANDSDPDAGATLSVSTVGSPQHGTAAAGAGGSIAYTPAAGYCGPDTFPYTVSDGSLTASTTVTVSVICTNQGPHAAPDTATTMGDTSVTVPVLNNDTDATPGATLTVIAVSSPSHGATALTAGQVVYTPTLYYCGTDAFGYTVSDGTLAATGAVTVTVACVNHAPQPVDDAVSTAEDTAASFDVLANDTDPDAGQTLSLVSVTSPSHGSASVQTGKARYVPAANYCGPDAFSYTVSDGQGGSAKATVFVNVTCVDDPPVIAGVANQSTPWGSLLTVPLSATDIDGPALSFSLVSGPGTVSSSGTYSWIPGSGDIGAHTVTVQVSDGTLTSQTTFQVTVGLRAAHLAWAGPVTGEHGDPVQVSAVLTDAQNSAGLPSEPLGLSVGTAATSGSTDGGGVALSSVVLADPGGQVTATAIFAGDAFYTPTSVSLPFTITKEPVSVAFAGQYLTLISGSTAAVPLTATVTTENDDAPLADLGTASVTFAQLGGGVLCSAPVTPTGPGQGVASCLTTPPLSPGTRAVVVSVTGPSYAGPLDVGVFTVAVSTSGMAAGAGRVGTGTARSDFGFSAVPQKKGASGDAIEIFRSATTATVVTAPGLSSLSTSCTTTRPKVCSATVQATSAATVTLNLSTGAVAALTGNSQVRIDATDVAEPVGGSVPPDKIALAISGTTSFTLGSPTNQQLISAGNIRIPG